MTHASTPDPGLAADHPPPGQPSARSVRLTTLFLRAVRPVADRWQPRGTQLRVMRRITDGGGYVRLPVGARFWRYRDAATSGFWLRTPGAHAGNGVVLHLHGGGFVFGSPRSHRALAYQLSRATAMPVLLPHYRRAPEHPFPAAADDSLAAYRMLLDRGVAAERIRLCGDSAGGHLAAGLLVDLARAGLPMPKAVALYSPFLDLTCANLDELDRGNRDPFIAPAACRRVCRAYLDGADPTDPRLDVIGADKAGWPPVLIQVGDTECLRGDAERMAATLRAAGVPTELQVWPGQIHVFQSWAALPEARAANRYTGRFLTRDTTAR